jgi:hypothetical protein
LCLDIDRLSVAQLPHPLRRIVEHVYLTDAGGTPMVHLSRRFPTDKDPDLIASMFTAIQNFMDDSFHSMGIGDVRSIEMGDRHHVAFGRGHSVLLYVVYRGRESNRLERHVIRFVHDLEGRFASLLREWDGDMDRIVTIRDHLSEEWHMHPRPVRSKSAGPPQTETLLERISR